MINVHYSSVDGYRATRRFKTVQRARKYAIERVGEHPDMGRSYAVSFDGVGKIEVTGATLAELFEDQLPAEDTWFALSQDGIQASGPLSCLSVAQREAWAIFEAGGGVCDIEEWKGQEQVKRHGLGVPQKFGPALPDGTFLVVESWPIFCQITDGHLGSESRIVNVARDQAHAEAMVQERYASLGEDYDGDTDYEVRVVKGNHWVRPGTLNPGPPPIDDLMPF